MRDIDIRDFFIKLIITLMCVVLGSGIIHELLTANMPFMAAIVLVAFFLILSFVIVLVWEE